jgi:hypothetical protein
MLPNMTNVETQNSLVKPPLYRFNRFGAFVVALAFGAGSAAHATVIDTQTLTIAPTGVLDLKNNNLIVRTGSLATITGYIKTGLYNGPNGFWDGPGINSSTAATNPNQSTAVGVLDNSLAGYTDWPPLSPVHNLAGTEILVKYTYFGDADLDGTVTAGDYILIDSGFSTPGASGWVNGDFDYDGAVTAADYILIDSGFGAFSGGGGQLGPSPTGGIAAVPEPTSMGLLALGAVGLAVRSSRQSRKKDRITPRNSALA